MSICVKTCDLAPKFDLYHLGIFLINTWLGSIFFQETAVLEELRLFERYRHVQRKKLLPVVNLFLGSDPWRRGKRNNLCLNP